jgi:hypothetical protein
MGVTNGTKGVLPMKKIFKIVAIVFFILLILQIAIFLTARYGWKLFGFDMCESPNVLCVETVYVTDETVNIVGNTSSSATSYIGYTYEIKDNILYLGIKQNLLFGFNNRNGGYSFQIEDDLQDIESICLVNEKEEKCIWSAENDEKYMEKINKVRLYETISVSDEVDYKEQMKNAEFVYADAELLNRIQHPTFSDELYLSKGGYLGVAELDNGEKLYLEFERHYNYYDIIGAFGHYDY